MQSVLLDQAGGVFVDALGSNHTALHATVFPLWLTPEIMDLGGVNASGTATKTLRFLREKGMACSVYVAHNAARHPSDSCDVLSLFPK